MHVTRRRFITTTAAIALAPTVLSSRARASHYDEQPDHVTLEFDRDWLETYQPSLILEGDSRSKLNGLYAWKAISSEETTTVGVYWAEYTHQQGVTSFDSHYGDHEPVYVFVDHDQVTQIAYSGYHWLRAKTTDPPTTDATRPTLRVIAPWHHYIIDTKAGVTADLHDLDTVFQSWLDNGLENDLQPGTVVNPWRMTSRSHWWRDNAFGFSGTATIVRTFHRVGLFGGRQTDL